VSSAEPDEPRAPAASDVGGEWRVRRAGHDDVEAAAHAIGSLLSELGGTPPGTTAMCRAVSALIDSPSSGTVFVVDCDEEIVGVLGASWQMAIHIPGSYGLIQDLWVHPKWRGQAIGASLIAALFELAREMGIERVEVGLPGDGYTGLSATEAFYRNNGFTAIGLRMRRLL
jgi:GNAT superfamily N-acetyltransferase